MMTLDHKWNQVHFDQETKSTKFKVSRVSAIKCNQGKVISQHGIIIHF